MEHFAALFGIINMPAIALFWLTDPLYGIILNGDDISDADFVPVSIGFAVVSLLSLISVIFIILAGRKIIRMDKTEQTNATPNYQTKL